MHCLIKYFVLSVVLFGANIDGRIILDGIFDVGTQVGETVDCGFRKVDNFLGIGKPCQKRIDANQEPRQPNFGTNAPIGSGQKNEVTWQIDDQRENNGPTSPRQQNFGIWNFEQPSGSQQNGRTQNGNEIPTGNKPGYDFGNNGPEKKQEVFNVSTTQSNHVEPTTQASKTPPKLGPNNGRRIISARSNCPEGYAADARGRCREIM